MSRKVPDTGLPLLHHRSQGQDNPGRRAVTAVNASDHQSELSLNKYVRKKPSMVVYTFSHSLIPVLEGETELCECKPACYIY